MIRVLCLDDQKEYFVDAFNGREAMNKMLYTLDLSHKDSNAKIELCNGRTWSLTHNGKTYACLK